ncbi:MAG: type II toxin-antitoxin system ParD family antitoxin [bacterium]|nr:type II toxin-antitoxin system ParD family antitoxin [bacterium]
MTTISVPISEEQEKFIDSLVKSGKAANKAHAVRQALARFEEHEAVAAVLQAEREPILRGDLKKLLKKF